MNHTRVILETTDSHRTSRNESRRNELFTKVQRGSYIDMYAVHQIQRVSRTVHTLYV